MKFHLSYADVVSTVALFVALGGASYAAIALPSDSVGSRQVRAGAITLPKLAFPLGAAVGAHDGAQTLSPVDCGSALSPCPAPIGSRLATTTVTLSAPATVLLVGAVDAAWNSDGRSSAPAHVYVSVRDSKGAIPRPAGAVSAVIDAQHPAEPNQVSVLTVSAGRHKFELVGGTTADPGITATVSHAQIAAIVLPRFGQG